MKRWDVFRDKREKFFEYYVGVKNRKNRGKLIVTALVLHKMLKYLSTYYNVNRNEALRKAVQNFKAFQIQHRIKKALSRKGPSVKDRLKQHFRR